jgi:hypothetical protein
MEVLDLFKEKGMHYRCNGGTIWPDGSSGQGAQSKLSPSRRLETGLLWAGVDHQ